jgi:hypothetical protein
MGDTERPRGRSVRASPLARASYTPEYLLEPVLPPTRIP